VSALSVASYEAKFAREALADLPRNVPAAVRAAAEQRARIARARFDALSMETFLALVRSRPGG
jgi:hypothetical protein